MQIILINIQKAFDLLNEVILINTLEAVGFLVVSL